MRISKKIIIIIGLLLFIGAVALYEDPEYIEPVGKPTPEETLSFAAEAIKSNDIEEALKMFRKGSQNKIKDSLNQLDSQGREEYAQALNTAIYDPNTEIPTTDEFKTYTTQIQVEGRGAITVHFDMIKLPNGNWVIFNL